jgi:hypothetical protein
MTYGSEIWISDFNIKLDNIHVLPLLFTFFKVLLYFYLKLD